MPSPQIDDDDNEVVPAQQYDIKFELDEAKRFLEVLFPNTNQYVFTTFADNKLIKGKAKRAYTRELIGTFSQHQDELTKMNEIGAGVYVTVNNNDNKGRKTENITAMNCVYIEADHNTAEIPRLLEKAEIEPSIIIESSPGKYHYYFLVEGHVDNFEEARGVLQTLVNGYHGDNAAKDITRVLRIPGFAHLKAKQHMVKIVKADNLRYKWADILHTFPPAKRTTRASKQSLRANLFNNVPDTMEIILKLSYVSPNCLRDKWLSVLMGLHYEYRGSDEGLKIAKQWSRGDFEENKKKPANFMDDDDTVIRWHSFNYAAGQATVTLGTITMYAQEAGYMGKHELPAEKFEFAKQILAGSTADNPDNNPSDLASAINGEKAGQGSPNDEILKKISEQYAIATAAGGGTKIVHRRPSRGNYIYSNENSIKLALGAVKITVMEGITKPKLVQKQAVPAWINSDYPIRFKEIGFLPKANTYCDDDKLSIIPDPDNPEFLNEFYGFEIRPKESATADTTLQDTILYLVENVLADGDPEVADYICKWTAHTRRFPQRKTGVMVTLMGEKGTGKSMYSEIVQEIHEPYTYETADFAEITGAFNDHLAGITLLALEEATWGGNEKDNSTLKHLITSQRMSIRKKYHNNVAHGDNFLDIIATANPGFSVPEDMRSKERRFFTVSVSSKHAKDRKFFSQFGYKGSVKRKHLASLFAHYLDQLDLTDWNPQNIPKNIGEHSKFNQIEASGAAIKFLLSCIEEDRILITPHSALDELDPVITSTNKMWNAGSGVKGQDTSFDDATNGRVYIKVAALKESFINYSKNTRSSKIDSAHIINEIEQKLPDGMLKRRVKAPSVIYKNYIGASQHNKVISLPNRNELRKHFEKIGLLTP